jgi:hypothetical protein
MKNILSKTIPALAFAALLLAACGKGDGNAEYGIVLLYMPQSMAGGGMDNNYYVPSGDGEYTYNFKTDASGQLHIILGVLRSGLISGSPYAVDIVTLRDTTSQIVQSGAIADAIVMPEEIYALPSQVSVAGGKSGETFYLSVSFDALAREAYRGKKLVTVIGLANPSYYELYASKAATVVVLDVDAINAHRP